MEDRWLTLARRLHAIASTGLHFGAGDYDRERYAEVATIATQMLADLGNLPPARIPGLFPDFGQRYATPQVDVRGAVVRDDRVLLVREKVDGLWTLPGGYADVGLSAGENVVKEVHEEAGLETRATALYAVRHKARHGYDPDFRDFYKLFFLCEPLDPAAEPQVGPETTAVGWFTLDALPPLSRGRVIEADLVAAVRAARTGGMASAFD